MKKYYNFVDKYRNNSNYTLHANLVNDMNLIAKCIYSIEFEIDKNDIINLVTAKTMLDEAFKSLNNNFLKFSDNLDDECNFFEDLIYNKTKELFKDEI